MTEWRTIDSAPKDGSSILCFVPLSNPENYRILSLRWDEAQCWRTDVAAFVKFKPTHWMPFPPPPQDET